MKVRTASAALFAATVLSAPAFAGEAVLKGAEPGVWTPDDVAATNAAKTSGKPVMLNFTGSDWCGWCMLMDRQVFSKQEWKDWAAGKIYLVTLDFPSDDDLVPEEYRERNQTLQKEYGIGGYPTYVVLGAEGKRLGELGASRNAKPVKFIADLAKLTGLEPLPQDEPPAEANPAVARAVAAIVAAGKAAEKATDKFESAPTGADFVRILSIYSDAIGAIDLAGVPDAFRDAFKAHAAAFAEMVEEAKKIPADKSLDEMEDAPEGLMQAMKKVEETVGPLADAADVCGCDGDDIRDAF